MSPIISLHSCCGGGIETVLFGEVKPKNPRNKPTMPFFCKRRSHDEMQVDLSKYPLLEYQFAQGLSHSKPKYDTELIVECNHKEGRFKRNPESFFSTSRDVAMAWMQMGPQQVQPLTDSTNRRKSGNQVAESESSSSNSLSRFIPISSKTPVESIRRDAMSQKKSLKTPDAASFCSKPFHHHQEVHQEHSKHQFYLQRRSEPPPPPPLISHNRRFRICFGVMTDWRSTVDPKSGRTYYYNAKTRETQWRKPMELATDAERAEMERKERQQKDFFAAMEANILRTIAAGQILANSPKPQEVKIRPVLSKRMGRPEMVRTISAMDEGILRDLVKRVPSSRNIMCAPAANSSDLESISEVELQGSYGSSFGSSSTAIFDESSTNFGMSHKEIRALQQLAEITEEMVNASNDDDMEDSDDCLEYSATDFTSEFTVSLSDGLDMSISESKQEKEEIKIEVKRGLNGRTESNESTGPGSGEEGDLRAGLKAKPPLIKRNTCGTLYVGSTMSAPDKDATIKCVCGVYRAHIWGAEEEDKEKGTPYDHTQDKFRLFNDREAERKPVLMIDEEMSFEELTLEDAELKVPSLDAIADFYRDVFTQAQMESDCIIMSLIYVERLVKNTGGLLRPRRSNWRSLLISCLIMASKVWDDLSMWNGDFSQTCPAGVHFSLQRINELELAVLKVLKYKVKVPASEYAKYYFLLRSMLIKSGLGGDELQAMNPLDVEGAKRLEQVSSSFQTMAATKRRIAQEDKLRSKSMGDVDRMRMRKAVQGASLEHMVQM